MDVVVYLELADGLAQQASKMRRLSDNKRSVSKLLSKG
jgi:hypothetical protein